MILAVVVLMGICFVIQLSSVFIKKGIDTRIRRISISIILISIALSITFIKLLTEAFTLQLETFYLVTLPILIIWLIGTVLFQHILVSKKIESESDEWVD